MATFFWPDKDPSDVLDYTIKWSGLLAGDTIASVVWTVPAGLTQESVSNTSTSTTIWLSGGTAGTTYTVACLIVTAGGREIERSASLAVVDL